MDVRPTIPASSQQCRTLGRKRSNILQCDLFWTQNSMSRTARLQQDGKCRNAPIIRTAACSSAASAPLASLLKQSGRQRTPRTRQGAPVPGAPRPQSRLRRCLTLRSLQIAVRSRQGCQLRPLSTSPAQVAAVKGAFCGQSQRMKSLVGTSAGTSSYPPARSPLCRCLVAAKRAQSDAPAGAASGLHYRCLRATRGRVDSVAHCRARTPDCPFSAVGGSPLLAPSCSVTVRYRAVLFPALHDVTIRQLVHRMHCAGSLRNLLGTQCKAAAADVKNRGH